MQQLANDYNIKGSFEGISFINCMFEYEPNIEKNGFHKIVFEKCIFLGIQTDLTKHLLSNIDEQRRRILFDECKFDNFQLGDITDIQYKQNVELCKFDFFGGEIENLNIENIEIASKFYINKQYGTNNKPTKIKELIIDSSIFKENFKLHNCEVDKAIIKDSDFEKHADFYLSSFIEGLNNDNEKDKTINFKALNFRGLALFGDCTFSKMVNFQYVTFEKYCHFRRANSKQGLNLDFTNIQYEINFFDISGLGSKESTKYTSKETYRIIKHNFQKIGNQIEANKYHVLELQTQKKTFSLKKLNDYPNLFIYWGHYLTSNFSSNWILSVFWIFIVGLLVSCIITNIPIYDTFKLDCFNRFKPKYMSIFASIQLDKHPWIFLFHKISLGYLYYQVINAFRRDVRK